MRPSKRTEKGRLMWVGNRLISGSPVGESEAQREKKNVVG